MYLLHSPVIVLERSKYDAIDVSALLRKVEQVCVCAALVLPDACVHEQCPPIQIESELHPDLLEAIKTCPAIRVPDSAFADAALPKPVAVPCKTVSIGRISGKTPPKAPDLKAFRRK